MTENMPLSKDYNQSISKNETIKQTMIDADLILLAGQVRAFRTSITLAENLPNDDKLSISMGEEEEMCIIDKLGGSRGLSKINTKTS